MGFNNFFIIYFITLIFLGKTSGQINAPNVMPKSVFDQELYENVLDSEKCLQEMRYMVAENPMLLFKFYDAGFRIPNGILEVNTNHMGNYFQCLDIREQSIEGKYCMLKIPFDQSFELPFTNGMKINGVELLSQELIKKGKDPEIVLKALANTGDDSPEVADLLGELSLRLGVCLPKTCTTNEWASFMSFNFSSQIEFEEEFCRLPNDRPWAAADWVATVVFSVLGLLTILSTSYDLLYKFTLKKDPKNINRNLTIFSVYTNTKRLTTFTKSPDALECLDGIRSISMMWVILGHTFSKHNFYTNFQYGLEYLLSVNAVIIQSGVYAVDTFFVMTGVLLVYTSVGKMTSRSLVRGIHAYYLYRILRLFPLLATLVLLESSFYFRISDGPYWMTVARNTERCRDWWWTTLLYIQNYVNPNNICIPHSWYLAIDMQIHIVTPLILYWVLSNNRNKAWIALTAGILAIMTAATIFNFLKDMPSSNATLVRLGEMKYFMKNFYQNTLTRASPFCLGMALGYLLTLTKGKKIKINWAIAILLWILSFAMFGVVFYMTYAIMQLDWDNQLGDNLFNSFSRPIWALGLMWVIFACTHGYGGPINWFLSHSMWKLSSRISYAMYLFHYSFMFIFSGMQLGPVFFSAGFSMFEFFAHFSMTFVASFAVTVLIDAPFSSITRIVMGGGPKKKVPQTDKAEIPIENRRSNTTDKKELDNKTPIQIEPEEPKDQTKENGVANVVAQNEKNNHVNGLSTQEEKPTSELTIENDELNVADKKDSSDVKVENEMINETHKKETNNTEAPSAIDVRL